MKNVVILIGIGTAVILLGFGAYNLTVSSNNQTSAPASSTPSSSDSPSQQSSNTTISSAELAKNNGKNGAKCWVAVSGTVYDVSNNREWVNGEHVPSNGAAKCGRDETSSIGQSPHGSSVLSNLPVVGSLQ